MVIVAMLVSNWKILLRVDYSLLLTFVCFFVFVGNIRQVPAVQEGVSWLLNGREVIASVLVSQVISNVPAAVMLSSFTEKGRALLLGTNIGGLGTLIASLASLISFRLYSRMPGAKGGKYLGQFTLWRIPGTPGTYCCARMARRCFWEASRPRCTCPEIRKRDF